MEQTAGGEHVIMHGVELIREDDRVFDDAAKHGGVFEPESMAFWREACLEPGALVIDVGAYTGLYSIRAALDGARVIALEPNVSAASRLYENAFENNVGEELIVIDAAAADYEGRAPFQVRAALSSGNALSDAGRAVVSVMRLDDLMLDTGATVTAIKLDIEGGEPAALRGAATLLDEHRPRLIVEANTDRAEEMIRSELLSYTFRRADTRNLLGVPK